MHAQGQASPVEEVVARRDNLDVIVKICVCSHKTIALSLGIYHDTRLHEVDMHENETSRACPGTVSQDLLWNGRKAFKNDIAAQPVPRTTTLVFFFSSSLGCSRASAVGSPSNAPTDRAPAVT